METRYWHPLIFYLSAFIQGAALICFSAAGALLTNLSYHHLAPSEYGWLFILAILGMFAAPFAMRHLAAGRTPRFVCLIGLFLSSLSMLLFASTQLLFLHREELLFILNCSAFCAGAGFAALNKGSLSFIQRFFPWTSSKVMQRIILFFGLGCAFSPLCLAVLIAQGYWWSYPLLLSLFSFAWTALLFVTLPSELPAEVTLETDERAKSSAGHVPIKFYLMSVFLYGVCEAIIVVSATSALYASKELSLGASTSGLALFWGMVVCGRVLVSRLSAEKSPIILLWMVTTAFGGLTMMTYPFFNLALFAVAGLGCSALLPLFIQSAEKQCVKFNSKLLGLLKGSYLIGWGAGAYAVCSLWQEGMTLDSVYVLGFILALLMALLYKRRPFI